ncbi:hypothetical protein CLF_103990 [Clonorchis sinensis]|uniref:Uncharacterized protein n=1 Tax=Clonorchis sinensis TaxID=79923 RepID=G7YAR2_CLOSI|nr:hypothetical protein CLF_103990 [Clonorchis sinensis]
MVHDTDRNGPVALSLALVHQSYRLNAYPVRELPEHVIASTTWLYLTLSDIPLIATSSSKQYPCQPTVYFPVTGVLSPDRRLEVLLQSLGTILDHSHNRNNISNTCTNDNHFGYPGPFQYHLSS